MNGPLSVADLAEVDSVVLFVQRTRAGNPGFALTAENAAAVAEICRRLDGLPLAIELAAARARILPLPTMLARLDDRLALLHWNAADLPPRERGADRAGRELAERRVR